MNLVSKLLKVQEELGVVAKNLDVKTTKDSSYKAVSERDVLDAVKPLEAKHGIYSFPYSREVLESQMLESVDKYGNNRTTFMTRIKTVYRFVNAEKPEEFIDTTVFSEGFDSQDKGSGKAMTYADKYALMKMYKISTGEDPDKYASEEVRYNKQESTYATVQQKKNLQSIADSMGLNINEVLKFVGWSEGTKLTAKQYASALEWINKHGSR